MRVLRRGRHVTVTPALRQHIEDRRRRLERYGVDPGDVEVVLNVEKHRHTAEATLTVNGKVIQAKVSTSEMDHSVDQLHANISRQVRKRKEKLVSRRQRGPRSRPVLTSSEPPSLVLKTTRLLLQKLTLMEAVSRLAEQRGGLLVFSNVSSNRIQVVRRLGGGGIELIDLQPE